MRSIDDSDFLGSSKDQGLGVVFSFFSSPEVAILLLSMTIL